MRHIVKSFLSTGADFCLSPEQWLAEQTSSTLSNGKPLSHYVENTRQQKQPPDGARYVLDTGNAREGFLEIPVLGDPTSSRTSCKKVVREGDVIISRLRPYLRQVTFIPQGTFRLLGVEELYCSTEFIVLRSKNKRSIGFVAAWLLSEPIQAMLSEAATGGHHPRINAELILNAPVDDAFVSDDLSGRVADIALQHIEGQRAFGILLRDMDQRAG